ncbi:hypothetical protein CPC08DRAFT_767845 [Agrocybe pediades]|nr:hypothetical protein CPC08DRAFT_767845 [Agrocybe pediades]
MMNQDQSSNAQLPPEILSYIFSLAIPKQYPLQKIAPEVTLSHVSSYWRAVAVTTPSFWTKIVVFSRRSKPRLNAYLQRSGTRNVDITIDIYRYEQRRFVSKKRWDKKKIAFVESVADIIVSNMDRIRSLAFLCFSKTNLHRMVIPLYECHAPNLQRLEVKYDSPEAFFSHMMTVPQRICIFKGGAPNMRYLSSDIPSMRPYVNLFHNIISLDLNFPPLVGARNLSFERFMDIIKVPANLRFLTVRGCVDINAWAFIQHATQLELPHLQGLRLLDSGLMAAKFFLSISAPKIESLWMDCSIDEWDGLQHFLSASPTLPGFSTLKYLTMPNHELTSIDTRLLNALTFSWAFVDTIILSMLKEQNESLVLSLRTLVALRDGQGRPTFRILVNEDQFTKIRRAFRGFPPGVVEVLLFNSTTYTEIWWSKQDQLELS